MLNKFVRLIFILALVVILYSTYYSVSYLSTISSSSILQHLQIPCFIMDGSIGGLGNQLFRFAFATTVAAKLRGQIYIELNATSLSSRKFEPQNREFVLDYFQLKSAPAHRLPLNALSQIPSKLKFIYNEVDWWKHLQLPTDRAITTTDYWESEHFFRPYKREVLSQFEFKQHKIQQELNKSPYYSSIFEQLRNSSVESVGVHFRLRDFSRNGLFDHSLPFSYQSRAMALMSSILNGGDDDADADQRRRPLEIAYFIFSDDINFVKSVLKKTSQSKRKQKMIGQRFIFVSPPTSTVPVKPTNTSSAHGTYRHPQRTHSILEFYLMSLCKHNIIANSTFSWWAAYLNKNENKVVIGPSPKNKEEFYYKYHKDESRKYKKLLGTKYAYPNTWLTLNPFENL